MEKNCDILIVGAGLAGLSAARMVEKHNREGGGRPLSYEILDAKDSEGGRIKSRLIEMPGGRPIKTEHGPQWLHADVRKGAAPNALLPHVQQAGIELIPDSMPRIFYKRGQPVRYNGKIQLINKARGLIDDYKGPDTDLASFFATQSLGTETALSTTFGPVETGAPLHEVSTHDVRELVACNMGAFTRQGLSQFAGHYARDIKKHIRTNCPITEVHWKLEGREGGMVKTASGDTYFAKRIVLSPSVGVLKSGDIKFVPPLPPKHQHSLDNVHMGNFNKVFLVFNRDFTIPVNANTHMDVETRGGHEIFYLAKDNGQQLVTAFFGGELAQLCDRDPNAARDIAINGLAEIWGEGARTAIQRDKCVVTQWGNDPYVKGGYSRVNIGHHEARQQLAEPIGDVLYLAGEAMGTIHPETGRNWAT
ncbi:MAG: hypothetical protein EBV03_12570, partial [Proteobacteria bacterium]|nr:hypothetical protein [Pseudomonadota bacterium]